MGTEIKMTKGFVSREGTESFPEEKTLTIRATSSMYGETVAIEDGKTILGVPFQEVEKLMEKARKNK